MEAGAVPTNQRAFVTVTAIPSANRCPDCTFTVDSYTLDGTEFITPLN